MVDWDGLENRCAGNGTVGSNPTLSAKQSLDDDGTGRSRRLRRVSARRLSVPVLRRAISDLASRIFSRDFSARWARSTESRCALHNDDHRPDELRLSDPSKAGTLQGKRACQCSSAQASPGGIPPFLSHYERRSCRKNREYEHSEQGAYTKDQGWHLVLRSSHESCISTVRRFWRVAASGGRNGRLRGMCSSAFA